MYGGMGLGMMMGRYYMLLFVKLGLGYGYSCEYFLVLIGKYFDGIW